MPRPLCLRCRRAASTCLCAHLGSFESRTRVVFLQHPRERRVRVGTARLAHLMLPNSELHVGTLFDDDAALRTTLEAPGTALLFPTDDARDVATLPPEARPHTLVVVDGSWNEARKLFQRNAALARLPRVGFTSTRTSNYRIRREPAEHCLSTIEATVEVLERLEEAPGRFAPMLRAFEIMVDRQLERLQTSPGPRRSKRPRNVDPLRVLAPVLERRDALVLLAADANAHRGESAERGVPELLHLVARRLRDETHFAACLRPLRPLGEDVPSHIGLPRERILSGEARDVARDRWNAFVRPGDVLATWGGFPTALLERAGCHVPAHLDLRIVAAQWLRRRPGALADVLQVLGMTRDPVTHFGRAGVVLAELGGLVEGLVRAPPRHRPERVSHALTG